MPEEIKTGTLAPPELLPGVKVLVVDDNRTNRRILEGMLRRWEMKPTPVEGGEEALAELSAAREAGEPYALDPDGPAHAEDGRFRDGRTNSAKTGTIHGHHHDADFGGPPGGCGALPGTGSGAYLLKPIRQSELREAIARALGRTQRKAPSLSSPASLCDMRANPSRSCACCSPKTIR